MHTRPRRLRYNKNGFSTAGSFFFSFVQSFIFRQGIFDSLWIICRLWVWISKPRYLTDSETYKFLYPEIPLFINKGNSTGRLFAVLSEALLSFSKCHVLSRISSFYSSKFIFLPFKVSLWIHHHYEQSWKELSLNPKWYLGSWNRGFYKENFVCVCILLRSSVYGLLTFFQFPKFIFSPSAASG